MTGPDYYRAAERLLEQAESPEAARPPAWYLGQAKVHATLALATATALDSDNRDWIEVAGGKFGGA